MAKQPAADVGTKHPVPPKDATRKVKDGKLIAAVDSLASEGAGATQTQTDALKKLLYRPDDDKAITAAEELAKIRTPAARAALLPGLYTPIRSPEVIGKLHDAWGKYNHV